jgi:hypothetical protein
MYRQSECTALQEHQDSKLAPSGASLLSTQGPQELLPVLLSSHRMVELYPKVHRSYRSVSRGATSATASTRLLNVSQKGHGGCVSHRSSHTEPPEAHKRHPGCQRGVINVTQVAGGVRDVSLREPPESKKCHAGCYISYRSVPRESQMRHSGHHYTTQLR